MTMGYQRRTLFLFSSCFIAVVLIGTAYVSSGPSFLSAKSVGAESTHDLLVSYASKDTDSDGLPDWQEALYGTDPQNAHSVNVSVTDGEAVAQGLVAPKFRNATSTPVDASVIPGPDAGPQTLTDQFGKELFGQYLKARGQGQPTSADVATFVEQGVAQLKQNQVIPDTFNQGQVKVSGTGPDALLSYASSVEVVFIKTNVDPNKSDLDYFSDAVNKGDVAALSKVKQYAQADALGARSLMNISVPKELASSHIKLANALMRVSQSLSDMSLLSSDPLRAMLGMATYADAARGVTLALVEMQSVYATEHVQTSPGVTGNAFYNLIKNVQK
jgi:hypothetical protein